MDIDELIQLRKTSKMSGKDALRFGYDYARRVLDGETSENKGDEIQPVLVVFSPSSKQKNWLDIYLVSLAGVGGKDVWEQIIMYFLTRPSCDSVLLIAEAWSRQIPEGSDELRNGNLPRVKAHPNSIEVALLSFFSPTEEMTAMVRITDRTLDDEDRMESLEGIEGRFSNVVPRVKKYIAMGGTFELPANIKLPIVAC